MEFGFQRPHAENCLKYFGENLYQSIQNIHNNSNSKCAMGCQVLRSSERPIQTFTEPMLILEEKFADRLWVTPGSNLYHVLVHG